MHVPKRPTIARIWRGRTRRERANEYEAYNYEVGIKPLIATALGVQCLRKHWAGAGVVLWRSDKVDIADVPDALKEA